MFYMKICLEIVLLYLMFVPLLLFLCFFALISFFFIS